MTISSNELVKAITDISAMIDGVNLSLERAREIREKLLLSGTVQETLGLDALIDLLIKDRGELKDAITEAQRKL